MRKCVLIVTGAPVPLGSQLSDWIFVKIPSCWTHGFILQIACLRTPRPRQGRLHAKQPGDHLRAGWKALPVHLHSRAGATTQRDGLEGRADRILDTQVWIQSLLGRLHTTVALSSPTSREKGPPRGRPKTFRSVCLRQTRRKLFGDPRRAIRGGSPHHQHEAPQRKLGGFVINSRLGCVTVFLPPRSRTVDDHPLGLEVPPHKSLHPLHLLETSGVGTMSGDIDAIGAETFGKARGQSSVEELDCKARLLCIENLPRISQEL